MFIPGGGLFHKSHTISTWPNPRFSVCDHPIDDLYLYVTETSGLSHIQRSSLSLTISKTDFRNLNVKHQSGQIPDYYTIFKCQKAVWFLSD